MTNIIQSMFISGIVTSFRRSDITIGQALEQVIRSTIMDDESKWLAIGHITKIQLADEHFERTGQDDHCDEYHEDDGEHDRHCQCGCNDEPFDEQELAEARLERNT